MVDPVAMGLFDIPGPVLSWLDGWFGLVAPDAVRLAVWSGLGAAASMAIYRVLSPQQRLAEVEGEALAARRALDAHEGELTEAWPLIGRTLRLSFERLRIVLWPALVAAVPMIVLMAWLSTSFGHAFPEQDGTIGVRAVPTDLHAVFVPAAGDGQEIGRAHV